MATKTINVEMLAKMFLAGAGNIEAKKEFINELNVFPVPDGDTGTNMSLTIMAAAKEVSALEKLNMKDLAKAISSGSLRGARGNSGVILSQLFRGFTKAIKEVKEIDCLILANALDKAKETAYKAVMKPKEGTILTVARGIADKGWELAEETDDLEVFIPEIIKHAEHVLSKTPDMLPVLKEAGVVDSGGQGLLEVLKGAYDAFLGKEIDYSAIASSTGAAVTKVSAEAATEIKFGYCTEFIIMAEREFTEEDEKTFKAYLESIGDSIVCVADDEIVKVHVHTNDPGLAIQKALTYGQLSRMKIDNMREEHEEKLIRDAQKLAKEQKEKKNAKHVFIFPNNKNITLAANQAKSLVKDKEVIVIPTKTVPQGITAIINFVPDLSAEENEEVMLEEIKNVKTGQVTYAVRDTHIDDKEIHKDDIMGIGDSGIIAVGTDIAATTKEMLETLVDEDSELISIYYGADVSEEDAEKLTAEIEEKYPSVDVDTHFGGQPIYYYVLAVE